MSGFLCVGAVFAVFFSCLFVLFSPSRACFLRRIARFGFLYLQIEFLSIPFCGVYFLFVHIVIVCSCSMDSLGKTVTVQAPPELRRFTQATMLPGILDNLGKDDVNSVQFLPGGSFRASFSSPEHKVRVESKGHFNIGSHQCVIQATGPPQVDVYVHYYPFEAPDADIRNLLSKFGQVKGLRYQSFPGYAHVKTGSRIVKMVVEREIPSQQSIRGFPCRIWYKGQPIRCNICREVGHLAASCPNKGLCRRCKEPGHTAGQCTRAWNTAQTSVPAAAGPSTSGVPPSAPAPRSRRGAVSKRASTVPDAFEETKLLLAEAMEVGSAASDIDYSASEVDEGDEVDSESDAISDYDTSEEDHLLAEDVDLSLKKTRSATKRDKREFVVSAATVPAVPSDAAASAAPVAPAGPAAPAVPAAPAAPAVPAPPAAAAVPAAAGASVMDPGGETMQSSAPGKNNRSTKCTESTVSEPPEKGGSIKSNIVSEPPEKGDGLKSNIESCGNGNIVNVETIETVDVNVRSESSVMEDNSFPVDNGAGVVVATSSGSLSGPSGPSSSGVPAEVAVSSEPSGARKISSRKNRAARFSPMEGLAAIRQHSRTPPYAGRSQKK